MIPELLAELRRTEYDLVVSGSSPAEDMFHTYVMGDITRQIVNRAELPVLVVRTESRQFIRSFINLALRLFHRSGENSVTTGT